MRADTDSAGRPARRAIPAAAKRYVICRQAGNCADCAKPFPSDLLGMRCPGRFVRWDHRPPLALREIAEDGADYLPAQHHPAYIDAVCPPCHDARTFGGAGRATTLGRDSHAIAKDRRLRGLRKKKMKRAWPKGRKLVSRGWRGKTPKSPRS